MKSSLLLALLVLAPTVAATPVAFEVPAAFQGTDADVRSTMLLVAFRPGSDWSFHVESDAVGEALAHRYATTHGIVDDEGTFVKVDERPVASDWTDLRLLPTENVATLVVQAESVIAAGMDLEGTLHRRQGFATSAWDTWWKPAIRGDLFFPDVLPSLEAESARATISFTGLRSIEWTNAAVSCDGDCPREQDTAVTRHHIQQFLSNGTATLSGTADFVAFLGPLDLSFQGTARLPRAVGSLDCPNCTVEDDTLTVHGAIELRNVSASGGGFSADMGGAYSVRVGETTVGRVTGAAAAVATVALLAGLGLVVKLLSALISKRIQEKPLEQETRGGVFEAIEANPAVTRAELMRLTGIKNGQMVHHERVLLETGQVQAWKRGRATHYAVREMDRREAMRRRAREDPDLSEVLAFVSGHARSPQAVVVQWARERFGWSPSTLQDKLHLLLDVGLVVRERQGRMALYSVPAAVAPADAVPAAPTP